VPIIAVVFSVASYIAARNIKGTELLTRHINIVQSARNQRRGARRFDAEVLLAALAASTTFPAIIPNGGGRLP
jgi:hypothetical protein